MIFILERSASGRLLPGVVIMILGIEWLVVISFNDVVVRWFDGFESWVLVVFGVSLFVLRLQFLWVLLFLVRALMVVAGADVAHA